MSSSEHRLLPDRRANLALKVMKSDAKKIMFKITTFAPTL